MKKYTEPKFSMVSFDAEDIMTTSTAASNKTLEGIANNLTGTDKTILSRAFTSLDD